jgi:hypothetical protein
MNNFSTRKHPLFASYADYLRSLEWQAKKETYKRHPKTPKWCFACFELAEPIGYRFFDFHHIRYDNIFNERLEDLILLCRPCHSDLSKRFITYTDTCRDKTFPLPVPNLFQFTKMYISWKHKELNISLEQSKYTLGWVKE